MPFSINIIDKNIQKINTIFFFEINHILNYFDLSMKAQMIKKDKNKSSIEMRIIMLLRQTLGKYHQGKVYVLE